MAAQGKPVESSAAQASAGIQQVHIQVEPTSKPEPEPGSDGRTYTCEADIRVSEGANEKLFRTRLVVLNPEGWLGMAPSFDYDIDSGEFPSFDERADHARERVLKEFPPGELLCVFLLGTGDGSNG